jgi:hypothetical protein
MKNSTSAVNAIRVKLLSAGAVRSVHTLIIPVKRDKRVSQMQAILDRRHEQKRA